MTRVIHTGDTHLGYRQYHSPERRADFLAAFRQVIEDAIAEDVDAVVHAGDLFHDRSPSLVDVHGAIQVLRDLEEAGVPFLAVVGNHERTREGQWIDLFETLGLATRLGEEPTTIGGGDDDGDGGDVALYGLDFVPPSRRAALSYEFASHDAEFAALVAHGPFEPFVPAVRNDRWDLPAVLEAADVEFDAALLGDDHTPDTARIGETWATYCGSTERVDAGERNDRGYNVVEFDGDRDGRGGVRISRRGLETRPFVMVDLELAPGEGIDRVRERIREEDVDDAVVVVRIEGGGEDVHPARVEEFATERGALVARVSDRRDVQTAETAPDVSFADPDEAVRDRIQGMGLSAAATAIDATVRDGGVADANVRDRVRERVEELVDDDPAAFERPDVEAEDGSDEADDEEADDAGAGEADADDETDDVEGSDRAPTDETDDVEGSDRVPTDEAPDGEEPDAGVEPAAEGPAADAPDSAETGVDEAEAPATVEAVRAMEVEASGDVEADEPDERDDASGNEDVDGPDDAEEGEGARDRSTDAGDGATTIEDFL